MAFNKRANAILDTIMVIVVLFVFIIIIIFGKYVSFNINDAIQNETDMSVESKALLAQQDANYGGLWDSIFVFAFVLLWILLIVASFQIDAHPIFFLVVVIIAAFLIIAAAILSNAVQEIVEEDELSPFESEFPMSMFLLENFVMVAVTLIFSVSLVLYGKNRFVG